MTSKESECASDLIVVSVIGQLVMPEIFAGSIISSVLKSGLVQSFCSNWVQLGLGLVAVN